MNQKDLIYRLKNGDHDAFKMLVEDQKDRVYNVCIGFLRDPEDADDVAQEVFIQVFDSIGRFREDSKLDTWIYRIAVTKSLDFLRRKKRQQKWSIITGSYENEAAENSVETHPGVALENKEKSKQLFRAIDLLPENQKSAFILRHVEELSYKEIADVMDSTLATVQALLFRARKNLKKYLRTWYEKQLNDES